MDQSQVPNNQPKQGCGCGSNANANVTFSGRPILTEQQKELMDRIQKTSLRKNSVYKTHTRYFM